jgi:hypothetical protein
MQSLQNSSFHFEVLKKLHSMKSSKALAELKTSDRLTLDEMESLNLVCSQQLNFVDGEPECDDSTIRFGSAKDMDLNQANPANAMQRIAKLLQRNQELEDALIIKELTMQKLKSRNEELESELKRKEILRLSQLELLALRNVELEKELQQQSPI